MHPSEIVICVRHNVIMIIGLTENGNMNRQVVIPAQWCFDGLVSGSFQKGLILLLMGSFLYVFYYVFFNLNICVPFNGVFQYNSYYLSFIIYTEIAFRRMLALQVLQLDGGLNGLQLLRLLQVLA